MSQKDALKTICIIVVRLDIIVLAKGTTTELDTDR